MTSLGGSQAMQRMYCGGGDLGAHTILVNLRLNLALSNYMQYRHSS